MSDTLRTCIATYLWRFRADYGNGRVFGQEPPDVQAPWLGEADALIRELGLQPHLAKRIINGKPDQWVRRHVTDWEIVDD